MDSPIYDAARHISSITMDQVTQGLSVPLVQTQAFEAGNIIWLFIYFSILFVANDGEFTKIRYKTDTSIFFGN
jgi:hypothetical protein